MKENFRVKAVYGLNRASLKNLSKRLEYNIRLTMKNSFHFVLYESLLHIFLHKIRYFKLLTTLNVLLLDCLGTYRGWRHMKGLPTRGQRTWSNAWSSSRSNQLLRIIRLKWAIKYYSNVTKRDAKIGLFAEYNNLLWKTQWWTNWAYAKAKRLKILSTKSVYLNEVYKIDLKSIANGFIFLPSLKRELTKKQKALQDKSIYAVGYEIGFSKDLFKAMIKRRSRQLYFKEKKDHLIPRPKRIKNPKAKQK